MKQLFLLGISWIIVCKVCGQCPDGGLDIRSEACDIPKNLKALSSNCSEIRFSWSGKKDQVYLLKTTAINSRTNLPEVRTTEVRQDESGTGKASLQLEEKARVEWSLQAICGNSDAKVFSAEIVGEGVDVTPCPKTEQTQTPKLIVYPNPSTTFLVIDYSGKGEGVVAFEIYDASGEKVLSQTTTSTSSPFTYQINIKQLPSGNYFLKSTNKKDGEYKVKFVKITR